MKTCRVCNAKKPPTDFYPPEGRQVCKKCKNCATVNTSRDYRGSLKEQALRHYSPTLICACPMCPLPQPGIDFLSLDHINGRGEHDHDVRRRLYQWVKNNEYPTGFQVLCYNCNLAKRDKLACPHNGIVPQVAIEIMRAVKQGVLSKEEK